MPLFRRPRQVSSSHPIFEFWAWWRESGYTIQPHTPSPMIEELAARVSAIDDDLAWHLGNGVDSRHRLTVSSGGQAHLRPTAERWLRAAPPPGEDWEFRAAQEADPAAATATVEIDGSRVDLSELRFTLLPDSDRGRIDVGVFHPAFTGMWRETRVRITFLALDWLLGEDDVGRWLGEIDALTLTPSSAATSTELVAAVRTLKDSQDPDEWLLGHGEDGRGMSAMIAFRPFARWIDHPTYDHHFALIRRYRARPDGLPATSEELDSLHDLGDELEQILVDRAILVGYETHRGRRTFHVYIDGEDQNAREAVARWATEHGMKVRSEPDPAWTRVRQFTG